MLQQIKSIVSIAILAALMTPAFAAIYVDVRTDQWQDWRWREEHRSEWKHWHKHHYHDWMEYRRHDKRDWDRWCFYHPGDCR